MSVAAGALTALIGVVLSFAGAVAATIHWKRDFDRRLQEAHEEVSKQLVSLRVEPYIKFIEQLEPLSRRWSGELAANRRKAREFAEIFHQASYGPVGVLASSDTRELIIAARAACLQYADMKIPLERLVGRVWAIHQALRSDLGLDQPNWPNEIERRRLRRIAGDAEAIDAIVNDAVHITYGLYSDWGAPRRLAADRTFSGIIFDMDGLLLDTEVVERRAWQRAAQDFNCTITDEDFLLLIGRTEDDVERILSRLWTTRSEGTPSFSAILAKKTAYAGQDTIEVKESAVPLLAWARSEHVPTAVASSSIREKVLVRLEAAGILNDFDVVAGGDEVARGKPSPDIFQLAAHRLGCKIRECLILEDSDSGITAASTAGAIPILVPDSSLPRTIPFEIQGICYRTFGSLAEVLSLVRAADLIPPSPRAVRSRPSRILRESPVAGSPCSARMATRVRGLRLRTGGPARTSSRSARPPAIAAPPMSGTYGNSTAGTTGPPLACAMIKMPRAPSAPSRASHSQRGKSRRPFSASRIAVTG